MAVSEEGPSKEATPRLRLTPDPSGWLRALTHAPPPSPEARSARAQLGLPTDRPIVLSGHQAGFWHAGILAKWLAAHASSSAAHAHGAWIVVDQDTNRPLDLRRPPARGGESPEHADAQPDAHPDLPSASAPFDSAPALPPAFAELSKALDAAPGDTIAERTARANGQLIADRLSIPSPTLLFATHLHRLDAFTTLIDTIASAPAACVRAYNAAAMAHPDAGVRPLLASDRAVRYELPLWRLRPNAPRQPVMSSELADIPRDELAPRALLMTLLLRLVACDLFIHGTGGEVYDRVTDQWARDWLGRTLAPTAIATATLYPPGHADAPSEKDLARKRWHARTARFRPDLVGDADTERDRRKLVDTIATLPRRSAERADLYARVKALEATHRDEHAARIEQLSTEAASAARAREAADALADRTYPWCFLADTDLHALRDDIARAFSGTSTP